MDQRGDGQREDRGDEGLRCGTPGTGTATAADQQRERNPGEGSPICWACSQPIESAPVDTWRGEPVHLTCSAELRCGLQLDRPEE